MDRYTILLQCEVRWIIKMEALGPLGLNDKNDLVIYNTGKLDDMCFIFHYKCRCICDIY